MYPQPSHHRLCDLCLPPQGLRCNLLSDLHRIFSRWTPLPDTFLPQLTPQLPDPPLEAPLDLSRKSGGEAKSNKCFENNLQNHGPGKQPVPRCFECKRLFPSLWDLNSHFLREHQASLQREFTQTRSWKTCSLENILAQVRNYFF